MINDELGTKIAVRVFSVVLIGLGIWALMNPDLLADYDPSGRRSLFKSLFKSAWGTTGGIVSIIFGGLAIAGTFLGQKDES